MLEYWHLRKLVDKQDMPKKADKKSGKMQKQQQGWNPVYIFMEAQQNSVAL